MAKTKPTTALAKWDEAMAKYAKQATATEANVGGGNFISLAGGRLQYKGADVPGNTMNVIILDHILENDFYVEKYNPDSPQPPDCYALGRTEEEMAPHENSAAPQHASCTGCPQNEWGTADVGRGKACANRRRLALITEADYAESIEEAEVAYLRIPPTSIRGWAGYVRLCADQLGRPPFGVVTKITVVPDAKSQFRVEFELVSEIDDGEVLGALVQAHEKQETEIMQPYALAVEKPVAPAHGRRAAVAPRQRAAVAPAVAPAPRRQARAAAAPPPAAAPAPRRRTAVAPAQPAAPAAAMPQARRTVRQPKY